MHACDPVPIVMGFCLIKMNKIYHLRCHDWAASLATIWSVSCMGFIFWWLITKYRDSGYLTQQQRRFNTVLSSLRQKVERAIGLLKGRWKKLLFLDHMDLPLTVHLILLYIRLTLKNLIGREHSINSLWIWHDKCNICSRYCIYQSSSMSAWLLSPLECSPQKKMLRFASVSEDELCEKCMIKQLLNSF